MATPDELTLKTARTLEVDWQYYEHLPPEATERIAAIRSAGRKAGRLLGWKVVTHQTDPSEREDGLVVVIVVVREGPCDEDQARMEDRTRLLLEQAFQQPQGSHGDTRP